MKILNRITFTLLILLSSNLHSASYIESRIESLIKAVNKPPSIVLAKIKEGQLLRVIWLDMPFYIYHRTKQDLELIDKQDKSLLADPHDLYAKQSVLDSYSASWRGVYAQLYREGIEIIKKHKQRSVDKKFLIISGLDPISSCLLRYDIKDGIRFYDPCSARTYDASGRLFKKTTENQAVTQSLFNLRVVPSFIKDDRLMLFGIEGGYKALPKVELNHRHQYTTQTPSQQLVTAALYNDLETMLKALEKGANIEYQDGMRPPPLIAAIIGSDTENIAMLIAKGVKVTKGALKQAKSQQRHDVVDILLGNSQ